MVANNFRHQPSVHTFWVRVKLTDISHSIRIKNVAPPVSFTKSRWQQASFQYLQYTQPLASEHALSVRDVPMTALTIWRLRVLRLTRLTSPVSVSLIECDGLPMNVNLRVILTFTSWQMKSWTPLGISSLAWYEWHCPSYFLCLYRFCCHFTSKKIRLSHGHMRLSWHSFEISIMNFNTPELAMSTTSFELVTTNPAYYAVCLKLDGAVVCLGRTFLATCLWVRCNSPSFMYLNTSLRYLYVIACCRSRKLTQVTNKEGRDSPWSYRPVFDEAELPNGSILCLSGYIGLKIKWPILDTTPESLFVQLLSRVHIREIGLLDVYQYYS